MTPAIADVRRAVRGALAGFGELDALPARMRPHAADAPVRRGAFAAGGRKRDGGSVPVADVLVALSGGPDSVALAAAAAVEAPRGGLRAGAVVVDHGLQVGSADVAARAASQARQLGLDPVVVRRVEVGAEGGPEAAARTARYAFLAAVARRVKARAVAVAHHRDDRVETVLHRLLQGATLRGLAGIPLRRPLPGARGCSVVRPLFAESRASILAYLEDRSVPFVEDPTNAGAGNARARIRSSILPSLLAAYPQAGASILRLEGLAREASGILDAELETAARGLRVRGATASLPRAAFAGRSEEGVRRLLSRLLGAAGREGSDPPLAAVRRLREALASGDGKSRRIPVGKGVEAEVAAERVRVRA